MTCFPSVSRRALLLAAVASPALAARPFGRRSLEGRSLDGQAGPSTGLVEPRMHLAAMRGPAAVPRVAVTLDACDGRVDRRILDVLLEERIAATIFVTGLWLRANPKEFRLLLDHPDLFEIGDHGARHEAAVDRPMVLWRVVHAAGSPAGIRREVAEGAALLTAAGAPRPGWYRSAAAVYSPQAVAEILSMGYRIAGFSLNGDEGASLGAGAAARRVGAARDGDVIIAHVNQPGRPAGAGVAHGLRALKARGFGFMRLSDPRITVLPGV